MVVHAANNFSSYSSERMNIDRYVHHEEHLSESQQQNNSPVVTKQKTKKNQAVIWESLIQIVLGGLIDESFQLH